jgi:hypothetical protein
MQKIERAHGDGTRGGPAAKKKRGLSAPVRVTEQKQRTVRAWGHGRHRKCECKNDYDITRGVCRTK